MASRQRGPNITGGFDVFGIKTANCLSNKKISKVISTKFEPKLNKF